VYLSDFAPFVPVCLPGKLLPPDPPTASPRHPRNGFLHPASNFAPIVADSFGINDAGTVVGIDVASGTFNELGFVTTAGGTCAISVPGATVTSLESVKLTA
jgi:hypothetical protein